MINVDYPALLSLFPQHIDANRTESAAFLIWYLENYYRLEPPESVDAVCDDHGDKGVDGIFVNDNDQTITIFQAKISQRNDVTIGDTLLRQFAGTLRQFETAETIRALIESAGGAQVAALAKRLELAQKIADHDLRGVFLSNVDIDQNGINLLKNTSTNISFVGKADLLTNYISDSRTVPEPAPVSFDIVGFHITEYIVDQNIKALIAPIKAGQLVNLTGIANQSLFAFNVRGPLGKTKINRDIVKSIRDKNTHKLFPLFHNGITIIAKELDFQDGILTASGYTVVNGCQSLTALYEHRDKLTNDLRILTKFIKTDPTSNLSENITKFSNNQNGVKARDFMANNSIQIRLQNDFCENYAGSFSFEIKRGEMAGSGTKISNEDAGLFLMAFDLKEPWATHRKYQVFDDKYSYLFARPEVTADRIVMCQIIIEEIEAGLPDIKNTLFSRYVLTRYLILYIVRLILDSDALAAELFSKPSAFVKEINERNHFRVCIRKIVGDIIIDLNEEIAEYGADFDYRGKLRDADWVQDISRKIVAYYLKLVRRGTILSFNDEWANQKTI